MNESANSQTDNVGCCGQWRVCELFKCFRIAIHPSKLLPSLLTVVVLFVAGFVIDLLGAGDEVLPGEFDQYVKTGGSEQFDQWRAEMREEVMASDLAHLLNRQAGLDQAEARQIAEDERARWSRARAAVVEHYDRMLAENAERYADDPQDRQGFDQYYLSKRAKALGDLAAMRPAGVFHTTLDLKLNALGDIAAALINPATLGEPAILGDPIRRLAMIPGWLGQAHRWFGVIWLIVFVAIWGLLGGAISRATMMEVSCGERIGFAQATSFAAGRWWNYVAAPVMPLVLLGVGWLALALCGWVFFHVPVLNVIGGLLFFAALLAGFGLALLVIFWLVGVHLMYPALSAEGSDAFDAVARAFSYISARPWRFIGYAVVAMVYGVITYMFVGLVVYMTLAVTQCAVAAWCQPFQAMMPAPEFGQLLRWPRFEQIDSATGEVAAVFVAIFANAVVAVIAAYAISYYFAATSTIYLLLRRQVDGVETTQCYVEPLTAEPHAAEEKVEPTTQTTDRAQGEPASQGESEQTGESTDQAEQRSGPQDEQEPKPDQEG